MYESCGLVRTSDNGPLTKGETRQMPTGPNAPKRPADVIGAAVMIAPIATGEAKDTGKTNRGIAGAAARAKSLSPEARKEIARKAAAARWY
jgi:hypothetical protein